MIVTPEKDRQNQRLAIVSTILFAGIVLGLGFASALFWMAFGLCPVVFWLVRKKTKRRLAVMKRPFPSEWENILESHVAFFNALNEEGKARFRQMTKIFLDETRITGIKTDVDETTRVLVASSGIIPIFGFTDWEYSNLGEVLIYPSAFDQNYQTDEGQERNTLGMIGLGNLSRLMILSKPDLIQGFQNPKDKRNVGIHEFAHLVDKADGSVDGVTMTMPTDMVNPWIEWVQNELDDPTPKRSHIDDYAYTNRAEYFAVLTEYFFEAPGVLYRKAPELYEALRKTFHQDTRSFLPQANLKIPRRVGRNARCPCGSGKKYKRCCMRNSRQGFAS